MADTLKGLVARTVVIAIAGPDGQQCVSTTFDTMEETKQIEKQVGGTAATFLALSGGSGPSDGKVEATIVMHPVTVVVAGPTGELTATASFSDLETAHKIAKRARNGLAAMIAYESDVTTPTPVEPVGA